MHKVRLLTNSGFTGANAWFPLAYDRGYFRDEEIDVEFVDGLGAFSAAGRMVREGIEFGYGDFQALIEEAARRPATSPVGVYMVMDRSPSVVVLPVRSQISSPAGLSGLTITAHAVDVGLNTFEQYASNAGLDPRSVRTVSNDGDWIALLGLLEEGKTDALFGYLSTVSAAIRASGKDVRSEVRFLKFKDVAQDLYGSALMVSPTFARDKPAVAKAFVRAINRGVLAAARDPDAAIQALINHAPDRPLQVDRLRLLETIEEDMGGWQRLADGVGNIDRARMERLLKLTADSRKLPRQPTVDEVFTTAFLPSSNDRRIAFAPPTMPGHVPEQHPENG
jgi:NitT/TauT family transport system substrate-binding protein